MSNWDACLPWGRMYLAPHEPISETGSFAGNKYSIRVSPNIEKVRRSYYIKADRGVKDVNQSFKQASDFLRNNLIGNAASIWGEFVAHENHQIASRACFNMALAAELKNNYNLAIEWAEKSLDYNISNKQTIAYIHALRVRKKEIKRVNNQLNN